MPSIERTDPPYLQIAGYIRNQILSGELKDGDPIPSARKIASEWNVAMATAAKVLTTLRSEGHVKAVTGVGTVVNSKDSHPYAGDRSMSVVRTGRIYPEGHYARILTAELVTAPDRVADALGVEASAPVIRRVRTTYNDQDVPVATSVSWFSGELASRAPLLLETERIPKGTFAYVAEQTGRTLEREHSQLAATGADAAAAEQLGVAEGSPVLVSRDKFVDAGGDVIEYGESTSLPDQWVFVESSRAAKGDT